MIKNFLIICYRSIARNRISALINIMGFALCITCCMIIYFKIRYELSFDRFHSNNDKIYRVIRQTKGLGLNLAEGEFEYRTGVFGALPQAIANEIPNIKSVTSLFYLNGMIVKVPNKKAQNGNDTYKLESGTVLVQPSFFDIFDFKKSGFKWIGGSPKEALSKPNSVVLSKQLADMYFPRQDPIGRTLILFNNEVYTVNGVVTDLPVNTDFPFKMFISLVSFEKLWNGFFDDWGSLADNFQCFIKLDDISQKTIIESKIKEIYTKHASKDQSENRIFKLQPLKDLHNDSRFGNFNQRVVNNEVIIALICIGLFLIIIASVNYTNLALAQSSVRTREVGIRKTFGSKRAFIALQFLGESFILTLVALNIGILLCKIVLSIFPFFIGLPATFDTSFDFVSVLFSVLLLLFVSIISGIYPAFIISGYQPIEILRRSFQVSKKNKINFMRSMVVLQFTISIVIIISTFLVFKQLHFLSSIDPGFNKKGVFTMNIPSAKPIELERLKNTLIKNPNILTLSFSSTSPAQSGSWTDISRFINNQEKKIVTQQINIDTSYLATYELKLVAGRNIALHDSGKTVLVNQQLVKELNFNNMQEVIGAEVCLFGDPNNKATIVGVVMNYHYESLHHKIRPGFMLLNLRRPNIAGIRFTINNNEKVYDQINKVISYSESSWKSIYTDYLLEFHFIEDVLKGYYENERKTSGLINVFALITIFIGCIGILGLAYYTSGQKTKEIAIRKINGASVIIILAILSKDYTKWMAIAFVIACPIAYFVMNTWLQNFAYKTELSWWVFAASGAVAVAVAMATVSWQSYRAATRNPVEALRYE